MNVPFSPSGAGVPWPTGPTENERQLAALAYGLNFAGAPVVGPFAIYLLQRSRSTFVANHALCAALLALASFLLLTFGSLALSLLLVVAAEGLGASPRSAGMMSLVAMITASLVALAILGYSVVRGIRAYQGRP